MTIPVVKFRADLSATGIQVLSLAELKERTAEMDHDPELPHRVQFHLLIYIKQGKGAHFIDFERHAFGVGSFMFVDRNSLHAFDFKSNNIDGYALVYTEGFKQKMQLNVRLPHLLSDYSGTGQATIFKVRGELKQSAELLLSELAKTSVSNADHALLQQLLFSALILKLSPAMPAVFSQQTTVKQAAQIQNFLNLITEQIGWSKDATDYAAKMGVTYKSLNRLCRVTMGRTPKQIIDAHIVLEAKRRLAIENIQVKTLAYELGFKEVTNFTKYFKKQTARTPQQFKRELQG